MKLETETSYKTIEAYKKAASEAGLVLKPGENRIRDSGDYPSHSYTNLRYLRRLAAVGKEKEPTKIVEKLRADNL